MVDERRIVLEQKIGREWKSILCPGEKERTTVMIEWDLVLEKGQILKRTLRQIDCCHPRLMVFGRTDCLWECKEVIAKREK